MQEAMNMDRYLTEQEAARIDGMSVSWHQKARLKGDGPPFIKVSRGAVRYKESSLRDWMDSQEARSTSEYGAGR